MFCFCTELPEGCFSLQAGNTQTVTCATEPFIERCCAAMYAVRGGCWRTVVKYAVDPSVVGLTVVGVGRHHLEVLTLGSHLGASPAW